MTALVDTNVLIYRIDARYPEKQERSRSLLRAGMLARSVAVPHQAVVEFVAVANKTTSIGRPLLERVPALRDAEEILNTFPILYPNDAVVRTAVRGAAAYQLSWYDAHLWAYAEHYGLSELWSEDFQHGRMIGTVRIVNPFR